MRTADIPFAVLLCCLAGTGFALAAEAVPQTAGTGYLETVLPNGLEVVLMERREVPMVSATAIVGAGSALESEDFSGASHLLEHLLFNGTTTMSQEELYAAVDRIGGYNNAHTDEDHTYYTMLVPSAHAARGLEIQAAMLFDSTIPEEKYDKERKIVLEEIAKDRSRPDHGVDLAIRRHTAPGTPYARPVIGTYDSLAGIERHRVWEYYQRRYVPENVLLFVAGDFAVDEMLELVASTYNPPASESALPEVPDPFAGPGDGTVTLVADETASAAVVTVTLPAPGPCQPGGGEVGVLAAVLSSEGGPLRRAIPGDQASRISASYLTRPVGSALSIRADLLPGIDAGPVAERLFQALHETGSRGLDQPGLSPVEVLRASAASRSEMLLMGQRLHYLGMMVADKLGACGGSVAPLLRAESYVEPTPAGVAAAAASLFGDLSSRARFVLVDPKAEESTVGDLPAPAPPPPAAVAAAADRHLPGADLDRTLDNGLRVLVTREPGTQVTGFHVLVKDRSAREPAGKVGVADLLHRMLPRGTGLSDRAQLEARLERLGAELKTADADFIPYDDYYTSPSHSFVRLEVQSANWLPALDLLAELVRLPALSEGEFSSLHASRLARAEKEAASPTEVGRASYRGALLGAEHPLARPVVGTPDSLAAIRHEDLLSFAADYLTPAGMVLSVVGPHEAEDVLGAVSERFASAPPGAAWEPVPGWPVSGEPGPAAEVELGADQARIYLGRIAELDAADRPALTLLAAIASDRLAMTLREESGLAYRLGASATFSGEPSLGWLTVEMGTRPENREAALAGLREQMESLRREMVEEDEIQRIRAVLESRALMRRMTAVNRARYLGLRAFTGVAEREDLDTLEALAGVGREQLARLADEWLDPARYRVVVVR